MNTPNNGYFQAGGTVGGGGLPTTKNARFGSNSKKPKKSKLLPIIISAAAVLGIAAALITTALIKKPSVTPGAYENGDTVYSPSDDTIAYDSNSELFFYQDMLLVYTVSPLTKNQQEQLAATVNGTVVGSLSGNVNLIQIKTEGKDAKSLLEKADILQKDSNVLFADLDMPVEIAPFDDLNPWSENSAQPITDKGKESEPNGNDWWAEAIGAYTAWELTDAMNLQPVRAGILDTGVEANHPDLTGQLWVLSDYDSNSPDKHGTHVAGLIAGLNNDVGIRGIASGSQLITADWTPLCEDTRSRNYVSYLSTGEWQEMIKQMVENDVRVINNSWGAPLPSKNSFNASGYASSMSYEQYVAARLNSAMREGAVCAVMIAQMIMNGNEDFIILQAAGNGYDNGGSGYDTKYCGHFCSFDENCFQYLTSNAKSILSGYGITPKTIKDHIMIVGATENKTDANGNYYMTSFSNFGDHVDICAPGADIFSTVPGGSYESLSGTSMASPIVAGCLTLLWSCDKTMSAAEVREQLLNACTKKAVGVGSGRGQSFPFVNIANAVISLTGSKPDNDQPPENKTPTPPDIAFVSAAVKFFNKTKNDDRSVITGIDQTESFFHLGFSLESEQTRTLKVYHNVQMPDGTYYANTDQGKSVSLPGVYEIQWNDFSSAQPGTMIVELRSAENGELIDKTSFQVGTVSSPSATVLWGNSTKTDTLRVAASCGNTIQYYHTGFAVRVPKGQTLHYSFQVIFPDNNKKTAVNPGTAHDGATVSVGFTGDYSNYDGSMIIDLIDDDTGKIIGTHSVGILDPNTHH